jgi:hypothetical protein
MSCDKTRRKRQKKRWSMENERFFSMRNCAKRTIDREVVD